MAISWALHFFSACTFIFGLATAQRPRPPRVELRATGCLWPTFSCGTNPSLEAPQVQMCVCVPVCVCVGFINDLFAFRVYLCPAETSCLNVFGPSHTHTHTHTLL